MLLLKTTLEITCAPLYSAHDIKSSREDRISNIGDLKNDFGFPACELTRPETNKTLSGHHFNPQ